MDILLIITEGLKYLSIFFGGSTLVFRGLLMLARLTKTDKDDNILSNLLNIFEKLSLNVGKIQKNIVIK